MPFSRAKVFREAMDALDVRSILPTTLSAAELEDELATEFRERSFFAARVTKVEILQDLAERVRALVAGTTDHASQRLGVKKLLESINYQPAAEDRGTIKDLSTDHRIDLMLSTNPQQAQGYGAWMQGQHPAVLDEWPAQELYRAEKRKVPRDWGTIWRQHHGPENGGGRLIALKDDPIWSNISRWGTPYPPFDYNSGRDVRDVERDESEKLGLIKPGQQVTPEHRDFNADLTFEPDVRSSALRQALEEAGLRFDAEGVMHLDNYSADQPRHPAGHARGGKWTVDPNSARQRKLHARAQKAAAAKAHEDAEKASFQPTPGEFDRWKSKELDALGRGVSRARALGQDADVARLRSEVTALNATNSANVHHSSIHERFRDQTLAAREADVDTHRLTTDGRAIADHLPRRRTPLHNYGAGNDAASIAQSVHPSMSVLQSGRVTYFKIGGDNIYVTQGGGNTNGVYAMDAGKSGKHLYAAADAWALRDGRANEASGLTGINKIRRTTNMLNSALDHGTTKHLLPEYSQGLTSYTRPPKTRTQDRLNIASLALAEKRNVMTAHPELRAFRWNSQSRKVVDRYGNEVSAGGLLIILKRSDPSFRRYGIGADTAVRAIQTNTVLRRRNPGHP